MKNLKRKQQDILVGSSSLSSASEDKKTRLEYAVDNMASNGAYLAVGSDDEDEQLLEAFRKKFTDYRRDWGLQLNKTINRQLDSRGMLDSGLVPLCIDIETASICDLACKFCYRDSLATPDKVMDEGLFRRIVDQAAEMGVPSIKFNWRGEPLMNPKLPKYIEYAKSKGIIDTIINTNATHLTRKKSKELISAGLDFMIYSFDGGTKQTYELMRPGRFSENRFEDVYENIVAFKEERERLGAKFPFTKIQMILTDQTYSEQDNFYALFNDFVDEVTVTQYSERGGNFEDLTEEQKIVYKRLCAELGVPLGTPYLRDSEGNLKVSLGRKPCEQPYQRMLVTYDGRVAMCCYDWGAMHPIGYVSDSCFADDKADKEEVLRKVRQNKKGYELLQAVQLPPDFNSPEKRVDTLAEVWEGDEVGLVRAAMRNKKLETVEICKECPFKDTYQWSN